MSKTRLLVRRAAVFLLLQAVVGRGDERLDAVVKRLASVSTFAFGGVGFAGITSKGESDFKFVLSQSTPTALAAFEKLFVDGNSQAKAYALAGLKKLKVNRYKELLATEEASSSPVEVMRGCILMREPLQRLAKEIDAGEFWF